LHYLGYAPRFRPWWPVRRLPSDLRAIVRVHCYVGRHLTTLNIVTGE
jgi:hypothetical protein